MKISSFLLLLLKKKQVFITENGINNYSPIIVTCEYLVALEYCCF